jgi:hypothetical protein
LDVLPIIYGVILHITECTTRPTINPEGKQEVNVKFLHHHKSPLDDFISAAILFELPTPFFIVLFLTE